MSSIPTYLWAAECDTPEGRELSPLFRDKGSLIVWCDSNRRKVDHALLYTYCARTRSYRLFSTYPANILDKYCPDNLNKDTPCEGVTNLILRINEIEAELLELREVLLQK